MKLRNLDKGCHVGQRYRLAPPPTPFLLPWDVNESPVGSLIKWESPDALLCCSKVKGDLEFVCVHMCVSTPL